MKRSTVLLSVLTLIAGCADEAAKPVSPQAAKGKRASAAAPSLSLTDARRGFVTKPGPPQESGGRVPAPPAGVFEFVRYKSPTADLPAYLTPDPVDGQKYPAIVWITGGDCNSIGEAWKKAPRENDQTAAAYRKAGVVLMMPSLRGGNDNPGRREGFFGEVDDVIAAADYLASQPYVDPKRIYLGGHSTGGTLAMLVAESTDRFRAVFAFGPVEAVIAYPPDLLHYDRSDPKETELRSPGCWLHSVKSPLFVMEGESSANATALQSMKAASKNPLIRFLAVPGVDHFSILAPANEVIAAKILADAGPSMAITLSESELKGGGR